MRKKPPAIQSDDGQTLIVLDYPVAEKVQDKDDTISYYTMPMGIIITDNMPRCNGLP